MNPSCESSGFFLFALDEMKRKQIVTGGKILKFMFNNKSLYT